MRCCLSDRLLLKHNAQADKNASQQSTGGGTASAPTVDNNVTIIAAGNLSP
jgi:hypothetical protein